MLKAVTRSARLVDAKVAAMNATRAANTPAQDQITIARYFDHYATEQDTAVSVTEQDFEDARKELVPSVSYEELAHYERVRNEFEGVQRSDDGAEEKTGTTNGHIGGAWNVDGHVVNGHVTNQDAVDGQIKNGRVGNDHNDVNGHVEQEQDVQSHMEAWQARKIDEMMKLGFKDGSLARNEQKRQGMSNGYIGKGKGKARANSHALYDDDKRFSTGGDADNEADDA